jgi:TRAP-type mannitol/chloroaromatic compound transport system permease large subunit
LFAQGEEGVAGPWAGSAIGLSAKQWYEVHEVSFNVLLALIFVHVVGVVVDQILTGDKLVRAMFTGIKRVGVNDKVLEATQVGFAKAMGVLATAVIATGSIVGWQIPRGTAEGEHTNAQQRDHGKSMENNERHQ